ncbi:MAG TPA: CaiB/BaiF CoA-transferase family protein [Caulobacteraceae bacterium]|nr:CaiB/BaiF CoA-transferase family protein [Caulobacteraceae bacterium]
MLLQGLKVVEMATWVAGPGCAAVMADWGADVIKVESPAGDATRTFWPDTPESPGNPIFSMENRGKRGIVLDTASGEGRAALLALLAGADVFITNLRPGSAARAGLDYDSLKTTHPRLIYASISGYGLTGPDADLPAFDLTAFWSKSGVAHATIPPDQEPFTCRPAFGDHATAMAALAAILAAVLERQSTGRGRLVEVSLLRMAAYAIGWDLSVLLRYGEVVTALPRAERRSAVHGYFRTADERWICIIPRGIKCFEALMRMIGRPEILAEPRFQIPMPDLEDVREVRAMMDEAFAGMTFAEAADRLTAADVIWAPMATLAEMAASPQAAAAGCFVEIEDGWGGRMLSPASPVRFPEGAPTVGAAAPKLGQHTREVLSENGVSPAIIERLTGS